MFKRFFKWIAKWFREEFPPIQDPPSTEIAVVVEPEVTSVPNVSIEESEKYIGLKVYDQKNLKKLREFVKLLGSKELIGYEDHLVEEEDHYSIRYRKNKHLNVTIFTADNFHFRFDHYDMFVMGISHVLSFGAYEMIPAGAQGHLFDDATVVREAECRSHVGGYLTYEKSGLLASYEKPEKIKYMDAVYERTIKFIEQKIANLPQMKADKEQVPVFHKLWEQMDLPLDTGTDLVKL